MKGKNYILQALRTAKSVIVGTAEAKVQVNSIACFWIKLLLQEAEEIYQLICIDPEMIEIWTVV